MMLFSAAGSGGLSNAGVVIPWGISAAAAPISAYTFSVSPASAASLVALLSAQQRVLDAVPVQQQVFAEHIHAEFWEGYKIEMEVDLSRGDRVIMGRRHWQSYMVPVLGPDAVPPTWVLIAHDPDWLDQCMIMTPGKTMATQDFEGIMMKAGIFHAEFARYNEGGPHDPPP